MCKQHLSLLRQLQDILNMQWLFHRFGPSATSVIQHGVNNMSFQMRKALLRAITTPKSERGDVWRGGGETSTLLD